jgi:hypothetical protein
MGKTGKYYGKSPFYLHRQRDAVTTYYFDYPNIKTTFFMENTELPE